MRIDLQATVTQLLSDDEGLDLELERLETEAQPRTRGGRVEWR